MSDLMACKVAHMTRRKGWEPRAKLKPDQLPEAVKRFEDLLAEGYRPHRAALILAPLYGVHYTTFLTRVKKRRYIPEQPAETTISKPALKWRNYEDETL